MMFKEFKAEARVRFDALLALIGKPSPRLRTLIFVGLSPMVFGVAMEDVRISALGMIATCLAVALVWTFTLAWILEQERAAAYRESADDYRIAVRKLEHYRRAASNLPTIVGLSASRCAQLGARPYYHEREALRGASVPESGDLWLHFDESRQATAEILATRKFAPGEAN